MQKQHFFQPGVILRLSPPLLLSIVILVLGLVPSPPRIPLGVDWGDKIEHTVVFMVLAYSYMRASALIWPRARPPLRHLRAATLAVLLGALLEALQSLVPYRSADFLDLLADTLGAALALVAARLVDGPTEADA